MSFLTAVETVNTYQLRLVPNISENPSKQTTYWPYAAMRFRATHTPASMSWAGSVSIEGEFWNGISVPRSEDWESNSL